MKGYLSVILFFWLNVAFGQLDENFNDGSFASDPVWTGSSSSNDFTTVSGRLRSNSVTASSNFYLSTTNSLSTNCVWEFTCNLQFNPSGLNYADIYLLSDQADLQSANISGYFVRIGNSDDEISLYKRSGARSTSVKIIDGVNTSVGTSNNTVKVRVTRTAANGFTLERDLSGTGANYISEGSIMDSEHMAGSHFGFYIQQSTATFFQKHFFDDIKITPIVTDTMSPELISARVVDSLTVEVVFNEAIDSTSAKNNLNYQISGPGIPQSVTSVTSSVYQLHYSTGIQSGDYLLEVQNVTDLGGNSIGVKHSAAFSFIKPYEAKKRDIAINEIFADPAPQIDLPALEFVELLNTTDKVIGLNNWKFSDPSTTYNFGNDSLNAGEYLILCARADTMEFKRFGRVLGISPWPSLNNGGDHLKLVSGKNITIDEVSYSDTWYQNPDKKSGGYALERIDALSRCDGLYNWHASVDISGGTPGRLNSVNRSGMDLIPVNADSIRQTSDTTLVVYFTKSLNSLTVTFDKFLLTPSIPVKAILINEDGKQVTVTYSHEFAESTEFALSIQGISDCAGNEIGTLNQPFTFKTASPPPVRQDTAALFITEIFADPSPEVGLPLAEFVEIYNPGTDTVDLTDWSLTDGTTKSILPQSGILAGEFLILCPAADTVQYQSLGKVIGLSPWPSFTNTADKVILKSFKSRTVDSVAYSDTWYKNPAKKSGGWSLERLDPLSKCSGSPTWSASTDASGGTPGKLNSVNREHYDLLAFRADSLQQTSDSTLTVYFNKVINAATITTEKFILSPPSSLVKNATLSTELNQISLTFNQPFSPATSYSLAVQSVTDCAGNEIGTLNQPFTFKTASPPPVRQDTAALFITEIFADPSPEVGLPLAEFIEIYNPGTDTVDLTDWSLSDGITKSILPQSDILPGEHLIFCPVADTVQYQPFGNVIGLSSWPSFTNTADKVILKSFKLRTVDSVAYSDTWYKNSAKKSGGWSLERLDPLSKCSGSPAWSASTDASGGTPGKLNSVNRSHYDHLAFRADSLQQTSDSTLTVYFNKFINAATVTTERFILSPPLGLVKNATLNTELNQISLTFNQPFSPATEYTLTVHLLTDCAGNEIGTLNQPFTFKTASPPPVRQDTAALFITEIFADPSPEVGLPLAEFVEIYNPGTDTVDLTDWSLSDATTKSTLSQGSILPGEYLIFCPVSDTVQYQSLGKVMGLSPWPSFTNTADKVILKSFKSRTVDSVAYSDSWYKNPAKESGGWSLERLDPLSKCSGSPAWSASTDISGGTPGKLNSVNREHYDQLAFRADSLQQTSDSTLMVYFNKVVNEASVATEKFILSPASGNIKSVDLSEKLAQISLTFSQPFSPATEYALAVHALSDCAGNEIGTLNQPFTFKTALPPPVRQDTATLFITEIFADPSPEVGLPLAEFVEIYNPGTDTVDLTGWSLSDATTKSILPQSDILPGEHLIFCPVADTVQYQSLGKVIGLSPWPSFTNTADKVILKSFKSRTVDSVAYSDTWYKNSAKKSGGWSLERIDPLSKCSGSPAWSASTDASGGTPGKLNSVNREHYDQLAFRADSLQQTSDSTLTVYFNKVVNEASVTADDFMLSPASGNIKSTVLNTGLNQILLTFSKPFSPAKSSSLTVQSLTDCAGNEIGTLSQPFTFKTALPPPVRQDTAALFITEIFADPSPEVGLPLAEFVEIYNPGKDTVDLTGWSLSDGTTKSILPQSGILPGEYLILCPAADTVQYQPFGNVIGLSPWPSFTNTADKVILKSFKSRTVDSVAYSDTWYKNSAKKSGGWSLERIDNYPAGGWYNWSASSNVSGGTPGRTNSINLPGFRDVRLKIDSVSVKSDSVLTVCFNIIQDTMFLKASNFSLNGHAARSIKLRDNFLSCDIEFDSKFQEGVDYTIIASQLRTGAGIIITAGDDRKGFSIPVLPIFNYPLVINEVFADSSPGIGLPDAEYVELLNLSGDRVSLKGLFFEDETTRFEFRSGAIEAHGYLILCSAKDTLQFKPFGHVYGIDPWPALNNAKETLKLSNSKGIEFHRVTYQAGWHSNKEKAAGGWSLELINPQAVCSGRQNWLSSTDASGGTPGRSNSVFDSGKNLEPLKLLSCTLHDSVTAILNFNRPVDSLSASAAKRFFVNNGVGSPIMARPLGPEFTKVILTFPQHLVRGIIYRTSVDSITDCAGNNISSSARSTEFFVPKLISRGDILINEILFNPRQGGVDFVEVYNNSTDDLDLKQLYIATVKDTITGLKPVAGTSRLFKPGSYLVLTTNPDQVKQEYATEYPEAFLKLPSMPSFNDDAGVVVLVCNGIRIDEFSYSAKMHHKLIKNPEGVSLERISFKRDANELGNFRSAAASAGFATPGYKNSQFWEDANAVGEEIFLSSKTVSPDNDGTEDALQLNFHLPDAGWVANISVYNDRGLLIKKLARNLSLAVDGRLYWDGLTETDERAPMGIYVLVMEMFDQQGRVKKYKRSFVVAGKLN